MGDVVGMAVPDHRDHHRCATRWWVEWERTRELLVRWMPPAPARILHVTDGPGRESGLLADAGYEVTVLAEDPAAVPTLPGHRRMRTLVGRPDEIPLPDGAVDAVLITGPVSDLTAAGARARVLAEAARCTGPGGVVVVTATCRWALPLTRAARREISHPCMQGNILRTLETGQDPTGDLDLADYLHDPEELRAELSSARLCDVEVLGVEGPLGAAAREDASLTECAISAARLAEATAPQLSLHLMARGVVRCPA